MHEHVASNGTNGDWISRYFETVGAELLCTAETELTECGALASVTEDLLRELRANYNDVLDFELQQAQSARKAAGGDVDEDDVAEGNAAFLLRFKMVLQELPPPPLTRSFGKMDRRVCRIGEDHQGFRGR
ncbi:MAG: hypothetical protein PHS73_01230 [Candidatus Peribacteraceae bacterium]|nr:hypothetical protein [Candidatus Peribacteraceae bacterium]